MRAFIVRHKYFLILVCLANSYFLLSQVPLFIFILRTPIDTYYPLYHTNNLFDYNFYLSAITQGAHGAWLLRDTVTTEATNATVFYIFYIWLGKLAWLFSLPPHSVYHIARILGFELFVLLLYIFIKKMLSHNLTLWASIFAIVATITPLPFFGELGAFRDYTPWWASVEAFKRIDVMPHYLWGYNMLLVSLLVVYEFLRTKKSIFLIISMGTTFFGGLIFPPSVIPVLIGLLISISLQIASNVSWKAIKNTLPLCIPVATSLISILIIYRENWNGFPWSTWNNWEIQSYNNDMNFERALPFIFGILPFLALPSALRLLIRGTFMERILVCWAFSLYILVPFADIFHLSKYRFVTNAPFIPMAILATKTVFTFTSQKIRIFLLVLFFVTTVPVSLFILKNDIIAAKNFPLFPVLFISTNHWKAIEYITNNVPHHSVFFSDIYMGSILAAQTNNTSFIGHDVHTFDAARKKEYVKAFFSGHMTDADRKEFLSQFSLQYIYFGPEERGYGLQNLPYPELRNIYQNPDVVIYRIL